MELLKQSLFTFDLVHVQLRSQFVVFFPLVIDEVLNHTENGVVELVALRKALLVKLWRDGHLGLEAEIFDKYLFGKFNLSEQDMQVNCPAIP